VSHQLIAGDAIRIARSETDRHMAIPLVVLPLTDRYT